MRLTDEQLAQIRALSDMMGRVSVCWNAVGDLLDEVDRLRAVVVRLKPDAETERQVAKIMNDLAHALTAIKKRLDALEIVVSIELNPEAGSDQAISEEMRRMGVNER